MPVLLLSVLAALAHPPEPPEGCFDAVLVDPTGIGDAPTCWLVSGDGVYVAPEVTEGDLTVRELADGRVVARCVARVPNDHGHTVRWDATTACATDPDVMCEVGLPDGANVGTLDWRLVVTPTGRATLTCVYAP